ncbi:MAG: outer membrane lipoprotein chaperone LolA [Cellvibrionales bacterium]|nr:outer membrane lipoprotein chaperone LolA [Cellvibrionales bacterium]
MKNLPIWRTLWPILLLPLLGANQPAQPAPKPTADQELAALLAPLQTFRAAFHQRVTEEDGYLLDASRGIMSFTRPNQLYWQITTPAPALLIADGTALYYHDPELKQVRIRPWIPDPAQNPIAIFAAADAPISQSHQVTKLPTAKDSPRYRLRPKDPAAGYQQLTLTFAGGQPTRIEILDPLGQHTQIDFQPLQDPQAIPADPYRFTPPPDTEIIHER